MTSKTLQHLSDVMDVLAAFPSLPEPYSVSAWPEMRPTISWHTDEDTARSIIATVHPVAQDDRDWHAYTYDDKPQTIAACLVAGVDLTVVVADVIPDLASPQAVVS